MQEGLWGRLVEKFTGKSRASKTEKPVQIPQVKPSAEAMPQQDLADRIIDKAIAGSRGERLVPPVVGSKNQETYTPSPELDEHEDLADRIIGKAVAQAQGGRLVPLVPDKGGKQETYTPPGVTVGRMIDIATERAAARQGPQAIGKEVAQNLTTDADATINRAAKAAESRKAWQATDEQVAGNPTIPVEQTIARAAQADKARKKSGLIKRRIG